MHDTYLWGYGECILCVMYLRVKIQCILNVSWMYRKEGYISLGKIHFLWWPKWQMGTNVSCCISMYLDVSWCILMNTCRIHAGYMQDTSGYVLYRNPPPICIGNPPAPSTPTRSDEARRRRHVQFIPPDREIYRYTGTCMVDNIPDKWDTAFGRHDQSTNASVTIPSAKIHILNPRAA